MTDKITSCLLDKDNINIIAGPCAIESKESLEKIAVFLSEKNIKFLRGGAYKLRTSPKSFQGLGEYGVKLLNECAKKYNMYSVCEITCISQIDLMQKYIDVLLIGTRNMYNYPLLEEISKTDKPVILKRSMSATTNEWLLAAEYLKNRTKSNVILCERGIRTFETNTRNTLDLASAVWVKQNSDYPVIIDPSHATGNAGLVLPMSMAAIASGIDALMIEVHNDPTNALSDNYQMLDFKQFEDLLSKIKSLKKSLIHI